MWQFPPGQIEGGLETVSLLKWRGLDVKTKWSAKPVWWWLAPIFPSQPSRFHPQPKKSHKKEWFRVQPALLAYTTIRHRVRPDAYCRFGAGLRTNCGQERRRDLKIRVSGPTLGRLDPGFLRRPKLSTELLPAPRAHYPRRRYRQRHQLFRRNRRS